MPYEIGWRIMGRVICVRYSGELEIEEVMEADHHAGQLALHESTGDVYLMMDLRDVTGLNMPPDVMSKLQTYISGTAQFSSWAIVIGGDTMVKFLARTWANLDNVRLHFVPNMSDARKFLKTVDPELEWPD